MTHPDLALVPENATAPQSHDDGAAAPAADAPRVPPPAELRAMSDEALADLLGGDLRPYDRRKVKEEQHRRAAERRAAKRAGRKTSPEGDAAPAVAREPVAAPSDPPAALAPVDPTARREAVARFLQGVFRLLGFVGGFLGFAVEPLATGDARTDAEAWLPLVARYTWLEGVVAFAAGPLTLIERLGSHIKAKPPAPPAETPRA